MSSTAFSYCGPCGQPDDACRCVLCIACGRVAALEHAEPAHYDETLDGPACDRCSAERKAMRDAHELKLTREQARLERQGWVFTVFYFDTLNEFYVSANHDNRMAKFVRPDRNDALAQALQFASCEEGASHAAE
jgi:hypothetical protein